MSSHLVPGPGVIREEEHWSRVWILSKGGGGVVGSGLISLPGKGVLPDGQAIYYPQELATLGRTVFLGSASPQDVKVSKLQKIERHDEHTPPYYSVCDTFIAFCV